MYERLLDKNTVPTAKMVKEYMGEEAVENSELLKRAINNVYDINIDLKFPFGNNYGWGYKVSYKSKHLFYLFPEKGSFTVMIQIKGIETENEIEKMNKLSDEGKDYWKNKYPCGKNGGWIHYRIINKMQLKDIGIFLSIKTNKEIKI